MDISSSPTVTGGFFVYIFFSIFWHQVPYLVGFSCVFTRFVHEHVLINRRFSLAYSCRIMFYLILLFWCRSVVFWAFLFLSQFCRRRCCCFFCLASFMPMSVVTLAFYHFYFQSTFLLFHITFASNRDYNINY